MRQQRCVILLAAVALLVYLVMPDFLGPSITTAVTRADPSSVIVVASDGVQQAGLSSDEVTVLGRNEAARHAPMADHTAEPAAGTNEPERSSCTRNPSSIDLIEALRLSR